MASSSGSTKVCFNSTCKQALEVPRQGWLCRTGDFADLCHPCASTFKQGKFCDTYHLNASGWRCCESCGKQIHCGCIVSFHMFVLLDAGGIECLNCAKTEYILTPNPTWPSASHLLHTPAERIKNISSRNWRSIAGSDPVSWRQAPSIFNDVKSQPDLHLTPKKSVSDSWRLGSLTMIDTDRSRSTRNQHKLLKDISYQSLFHLNPTPLSSSPSVTHHQISGSKNFKITTPLFEKVLTASDVGRIGRLVLPKEYAETYLPPIAQPEGFPLIIQDLKGKDWVLQYRFWPNNNSRMYVLEGVTPCIQSMQLQAGDTVTFNRLEPEGKIVMGFRKASPSDKANETWSEVDKISVRVNKRKKSDNKMYLNGKKHVKLNEEEIIELNITLEQVQGLLRPPPNNAPTVVIIEGVEFQDFQEAPIIGSPKEFSTNHVQSLCLTEVEPTPENQESVATTKHPRHKHGCPCIQPPSATKHKPIQHNDNKYSEKGNSIQNPSQLLYADIIKIDLNLENPSFKSQNIDLNIQPECEEESSPVSDSMGIMRLVQESTQRYIKQQKLSINQKS